ncbi:ubiquitin carboxyl-terminal hydrolase 1 [Anopheles funestus]|uniref:ubiquitin carboxyl-terminal hydrolase 1 n=1 Tax=Anopheles funestus TaxID=62324 RepID=UPI0020C5C97B|nr:ubiquitin carboxyl-terminal hydrolase 1 [Anopheles funestus]
MKSLNSMVTHTMSNSLATLCNIGNSCYMNSVLYTLRFAPNFTHNLHHLVEFLELVLHKSIADRKYVVHDESAQNELNVMNSKAKASFLHNAAAGGTEGAGGHSWNSKELIQQDRNVNGYEKSASNRSTIPTDGSGTLSEISFGDNDKCSVLNSPTHSCNSCSAAKPTCAGDNCSRSRNSDISYINGSGTKNNRQLVCETLHELFHSLARNEASDVIEPFHAGGLLQAVQNVSSTFEGNQQQDAHEFLMCILDSVRESCQILNKKLIENPDILKISPFPSLEKAASTDVTINNSNTTATSSESKISNTQFIARNIFRRRKESLKNTKSSCIKEGKFDPAAGTVVSVQTAAGGSCVHTCAGKQKINLPAVAAGVQESSVAQDRLKQRIRTLGLNFFCEDFEGVTVSRTRCLSCETVTEQKETMIDIAIPITSNEVSDAVKNPQQFYQDACITQEYFRGDNKYRCEVCSGYTEACRTISFDILPRLLVLQLKRFNGDMEKINSYIPTPFILQCFCAECIGKSDNEKRHIYRLYSVITHVGARMSVGHYIAYTSSLQIPLHYVNCVKDRQRRALLAAASFEAQTAQNALDGINNAGISGKGQSGAEKSASGQLKKLFGSKKTPSAGDISKKLKNNVINRFSPINGMESLQLNTNTDTCLEKSARTGYIDNFYNIHNIDANINHAQSSGDLLISGSETSGLSCQSVGCCAVHTKAMHANDILHAASNNGRYFMDDGLSSENARNNSIHNSAPISTGTMCNNNCTHNSHKLDASNGEDRSTIVECHSSLFANPVHSEEGKDLNYGNVMHDSIANQQLTWYMCDDDKIKIMTQLEFEEVLSPNRRHVTTPYLLFYARYDVAQNQHNQSKEQTISPTQHQQQQYEHKIHTALTKHVPPTTKSATISV